VLPSGRRIESYPKVSIRNLFYMLAVAFELPSPFRDEPTEFERLDEIFEFVASLYADLVEQRIANGLHRSYVETGGNLAAVRGRIDFTQDVRHNYVLRHRTYCRYTEFTWDIPENQIIRQVAHMLSGWMFRPKLVVQ
jgi:5-methylcytosine-specific restriction enzyme subunit McrC